LKSSNRSDDWIQIGRIVGAHGIRGVVKIQSYAESVDCYTHPDGLFMTDSAGRRSRCAVLWVKPQKNGFRLAIKDVTTRDQAESLAGCELWIPRKSLPPLDEDTHYWIDLIGMSVFTAGGEYLGRISDVIATGANDVYVVATPEGYPVKEILLPAIASVVLEVDAADQKIIVELPEGLI
jgi:16S rRNA processing protein RimM